MAASVGNTTTVSPALKLPVSEQVAANGTIAVTGASYTDSLAQDNPGSMYLSIFDASGALYGYYPAPGSTSTADAAGTGSNAITFHGSYADVQDIINSLTYVAAGSGGTDYIRYDIWNQAGVETTGDVPVTVSGGGSGTGSTTSNDPTLTEPSSETVAAGATQAVSGSYTDSFAAGNLGAMFLGTSDSTGTLRATDASGHAVTGSGSNSITLNTDYADVNAVLKSLTYTAGASGGSDSIHFDIWNQAGVETSNTVPVTITNGGGSTDTWTGAVSGNWNTAGNWSGGGVPTSGNTVIIPAGTPHIATLSNATLTGETITLAASGSDPPTVDFNNVVLDSLLQNTNGGFVQIGGTLTVGAQGTIAPAAGAVLTLSGTAETIVNNGLMRGSAGSDLLIYNGPSTGTASATLINNGSIVADGGSVDLASATNFPGALPDWTVLNHGSIAITNRGDFVLDGKLVGGDVAFNGTGALILEQGMAFAGGAAVSGFGQGDQIDLLDGAAGKGGQLAFANGTLEVTSGSTLVQAIPLNGSYSLGNFEEETIGGSGNPSEIVYAPGGQPSGIVEPDVVAPDAASVAQGTTLALNGVSIENLGTSGSVSILAVSGTLYMNGATGSGTNQLSLGPTTTAQLNADLASLTYVPAAGVSTDTVSVTASPPAPVNTTRWIPISITGGGPTLKEQMSATVSPSATVAVSGSYSDSFAAGNPGSPFLGISDSSGTLSATDASGRAVAGSGSHSIALQTDYVDVNAILASLHYTAGASAGSDLIQFDVWNQAGVETTAATAVTINPPSFSTAATTASGSMIADFAPTGGSASGTTMTSDTNSGSAGSVMLNDGVAHPIGIPLMEGQ